MFFKEKKQDHFRAIGLISDFGLADPYVGQMKAVFVRLAPQCPVLDISHGVAPFNIAQAAFFLAGSETHMPKDAVLLAVVDPGVGTERRIVGIRRGERFLLAPDNGLLGFVLDRCPAPDRDEPVRAFDLSEAKQAAGGVSATFHGRDVFAPLAAWLAMGGLPENLGREIAPGELKRGDWPGPEITPDAISAPVLTTDRFGNCVLDLRAEEIPEALAQNAALSLDDQPLPRVRTYAELEKGEPGILEGSQGFMEISVNQSSAAMLFGLSPGRIARLTPTSATP